MKKLIVSFFGAALLAVGSTAGADPPTVPALNWFPCAPGAVCAVAQVPLDYDEPQGAQTHVVLARYPATDQANRIGTVFINFGGPGISGVNRLLSGFGQLLAAALQGRFDVVSFDPRGVGLSDPLQCFATEEDRAAYLSTAPIFPYRDDQERHFFDIAKLTLRGRSLLPAGLLSNRHRPVPGRKGALTQRPVMTRCYQVTTQIEEV
jgi:hypothetical protein